MEVVLEHRSWIEEYHGVIWEEPRSYLRAKSNNSIQEKVSNMTEQKGDHVPARDMRCGGHAKTFATAVLKGKSYQEVV